MKILVPVDGSDIALRALKFAIRLCGKLEGDDTLVLLAVEPALFPGVERKIGKAAAAKLYAEGHERALAGARKAALKAKATVAEVAAIGEPAEEILAVAKARKVDLVVMGSHGRGAVKGLLLGSVSSKVLSQAPVPVTIVR